MHLPLSKKKVSRQSGDIKISLPSSEAWSPRAPWCTRLLKGVEQLAYGARGAPRLVGVEQVVAARAVAGLRWKYRYTLALPAHDTVVPARLSPFGGESARLCYCICQCSLEALLVKRHWVTI